MQEPTIQNDIQEIEISMEAAKERIALRDTFLRLSENKDWQEIIENRYFKTESSRLVLLKASQAMEADDSQKRILQQIDAIGHFRQYLVTMVAMGNLAEKELNAAQETHAELLVEEVEG